MGRLFNKIFLEVFLPQWILALYFVHGSFCVFESNSLRGQLSSETGSEFYNLVKPYDSE